MDINTNNGKIIDFSICTINGNLNVKGGMNILSELINVFKCDDKGHPLKVQEADDVFFQKLKAMSGKFKEAHPESYKLIRFLESIQLNKKFLIVLGNVNADTSLNNYHNIQKKLYEINDIQYPIDVGKVVNNYYVYFWGDKIEYVGERNRKKRVCRFCNEQSPIVTFKDNAHAISQSLGNKLIFCNEECDNCNHKRFSKIEQEFIYAHLILYSLLRKEGKKGVLNVRGKNITIDNKNNNGRIEIKTGTDLIPYDIIENLDFKILEPNLNYSPQNLYKCLCKFAVSVIDKTHLKRLSKTIHWLGSNCTVKELPGIWMKSCKIHDQPQIGIYIKKKSADSELPEFMIMLIVLNIQYLYVFPFVDDNEVILTESARYKLKDIFDLTTYTEIDVSSDKKKSIQIHIDIDVPEGAKIITINKSEFDSLSEEERGKKYPNATGFRINPNAKSIR